LRGQAGPGCGWTGSTCTIFTGPTRRCRFAESIGARAELKDEGKIVISGCQTVTKDQFREAIEVTAVSVGQNRYNVADRSSEAWWTCASKEMLSVLPGRRSRETGTSPAILECRRNVTAGASGRWCWPGATGRRDAAEPGPAPRSTFEQKIAAASIDICR